MTSIQAFLEGAGTNNSNWLLSDIWKFNDTQIENTHTFIQWVFPTDEPSRATPGSPVLDEEQILKIQNSEQAKQNLSKPADWFLNFLRRNNYWQDAHDHNHLRITRMIKSCAFYAEMMRLITLKNNSGNCSELTFLKFRRRQLNIGRMPNIILADQCWSNFTWLQLISLITSFVDFLSLFRSKTSTLNVSIFS